MNRRFRVAAATGMAFAAIALSADTAIAAGTLVSAGPGSLTAKGARASVPVTVTCTPGEAFFVYIYLNERVGGGQLASGDGDTYPYQSCTGEAQTAVAVVDAEGRAFKPGTAAASASLYTCTPDLIYCQYQSFSTEVQLKNK
jgi:hypothetical protein